MKEKIKNNKKYIKETILLLGGIIINLACFLMGTIYSNAQTLDNPSFPFYINEIYGANGNYNGSSIVCDDVNEIYNTYLKQYENIIISDIYDKFSLNSTDSILVRIREVGNNLGSSTPYMYIWFEFYVNPTVNGTVSNSATFVNTPVDISFDYYGRIRYNFYPQSTNLTYYSKQNLSTSSGYTMFGTPIIYHLDYSTYDMYQIYNYPVFMYNMNILYSSNGTPLIAYTGVSIGDFTDLPGLDEILNNINNTWEPPSSITGHALPSQPTENPNNNDFQNRLQMFDYLKDSINAIVGNLGYNIKNWLDNLIGKMVEGFNSVSKNIYNGFKTLMDNIKDFFGPKIDAIVEKFNYITEPFDSQELSNALNNGSFSGDMLSLLSNVGSFSSTFTSATEPQSCSFTLDFTNNGYFSFGVCTFSFDWILPFRSYIRLFLGCLCVYSLIVSIFTSINTYIGGTSSINDDI